MEVLPLGVPSAGGSTQAQFITIAFGTPQVPTGDMLRAAVKAGIPLGLEAKKVIDGGGLVRDDIVIGMMKERIAQDDCKNGFLLNDLPRILAQTEAMVEVDVDLDAIAEIDVSDNVIIDRMDGRRVHLASGHTYHVTCNPSEIEGKDDITGEDLTQRDDDREGTVKKRPAVYREQTEVLADFCSKLEGEHAPKYIKVSGTQAVEVVKAEVLRGLGK